MRGEARFELAFTRRRRELAFPVWRAIICATNGEMRVTVLAQMREIDAFTRWRVPGDVMFEAFAVRPPELRVGVTHTRSQTTENFVVGKRFPWWLHTLLVIGEIVMAPRQDDIFHLSAHRRRQHDIGIDCGVRNKVIGHHQK